MTTNKGLIKINQSKEFQMIIISDNIKGRYYWKVKRKIKKKKKRVKGRRKMKMGRGKRSRRKRKRGGNR